MSPGPTDAADARSEPRWKGAFGRFLIAHTLAYVPAFFGAAAWVPVVVRANFQRLSAEDLDEAALKRFMLMRMIAPALVLFTVVHLAGLPWILSWSGRRGRNLLLVVAGALTVVTMMAGLVLWVRLLHP